MTRILDLAEIKSALSAIDVVGAMEQAFLDFSSGAAVVPPVGELLFDEPPGDVHIKYGYVTGDDYFVVKVASGFYDNPRLGLPSNNGLMLLFRQQTGELATVLLDQGQLTDVRTAAAGAVAARYLAPSDIQCIGIVGTGIQAELQLRYLAPQLQCHRVLVCGRRQAALDDYRERLHDCDFDIETTDDATRLTHSCQLIVTTTASREPLLHEVGPGTHITAVGSDTAQKQELAPAILARADIVAVDSRAQSAERGEVFRAVQGGAIRGAQVVELGDIIAGKANRRADDQQITVADLTGIATQDIAIAKAVYEGITDAD